jgi:hypothetical protein
LRRAAVAVRWWNRQQIKQRAKGRFEVEDELAQGGLKRCGAVRKSWVVFRGREREREKEGEGCKRWRWRPAAGMER